MPTNSDDRLGASLVALHTQKGDPWVDGARISHIWSVGSGDDPGSNNFVLTGISFRESRFPTGIYPIIGSMLLGKPETDITADSLLHLGYRNRPSSHRAIPVLAYKLHDIGLSV